MAKKDFTGINTSRIYEAIETATSEKRHQTEASPQEQEERTAKMKTQGRKGCKAVRINMAFTPENHSFIKILARVKGQSMTEFTNEVISKYRQEHPEVYEQALAIIRTLDEG